MKEKVTVPLRADELLPRCGAFRVGASSVQWRVWAPYAQRVELQLFRGLPNPEVIPMRREAHNFFSCEAGELSGAETYRYRLDGNDALPDPCSLSQPEDVNGPSALFFPEDFDWTSTAWRGIEWSDLVIYELHIPTFTGEGTFAAACSKLESLKELGVTAIEVMPVAQFSGPRGWGYDGVFPFAVHHAYGGPRELQHFVDYSHQLGIAVFLDVVYNHFGPEGNYLGRFGPYVGHRYRTPWGGAVNFDDRGSDAVRAFVLQNVRYWLREFRFDGLRLDAVHAIYDLSARHILQDIKAVAEEEAAMSGRKIHIIAESDLNDTRLLRPVQEGGYQLDGQWSDDFHHSVHRLLTGESEGYYADFENPIEKLSKVLEENFAYTGEFSPSRGRVHGAPADISDQTRFVVSIQNHDQVGNRARGDRLSTLISPAACRLAAAVMIFSPFTPMLFMGEEYGEQNPFPFFCSFKDEGLMRAVREGRRQEFAAFGWQDAVPDPQAYETFESAKLSWSWPDGGWQARLRKLYRDLIALRKSLLHAERPELRARIPDAHKPVLRVERRASDGRARTLFFNFDKTHFDIVTTDSRCAVIFSTEFEEYGGQRIDSDRSLRLLPYECCIVSTAGDR